MLRRVKADCGLNLPPKREILVKCNMAQTQLELHDAILANNIGALAEEMRKTDDSVRYDEKGRPVRSAATGMLRIDYSVFDGNRMSENALADYYHKIAEIMSYKAGRDTSAQRKYDFNIKTNPMMQLRKVSCHPYLLAYPLDEWEQYLVDENIVTSCGKMMVLDRMLGKLLAEGHKVLLFSQFRIMLNVLADYLTHRKIKFSRLDGSFSLAERAEQIKM
jgi:ATP-dependent DNA helicase